MNILKPFLGAAIVAVTLLAGCGSGDREKILVGNWEVRDGSGSGAGLKAFDDPDKLRSNMATLAHSDLAIKDDKTFALSGAMTANGTWAFDKESGALTLTPTGGAPIAASLSEGNQQISLPNPTGTGAAVVLQKKED